MMGYLPLHTRRRQVYSGGRPEARGGKPYLEPHGGNAMRNLRLFGVVLAVLVFVPAIAQRVFDGTWKFNLSDAQCPKKPDGFLLQDGMYHYKTCSPAIDVKA